MAIGVKAKQSVGPQRFPTRFQCNKCMATSGPMVTPYPMPAFLAVMRTWLGRCPLHTDLTPEEIKKLEDEAMAKKTAPVVDEEPGPEFDADPAAAAKAIDEEAKAKKMHKENPQPKVVNKPADGGKGDSEKNWFNRGYSKGQRGKDKVAPEGPDNLQRAWIRGYEAGAKRPIK